LAQGVKQEYFELQIWLPGRGPLRDLFKAETLVDAVALAEFRYRGCLVIVPPPAASLKLIRSRHHTNPIPQKNRSIRNV
jgi:hypothetical protein